jgi:hypothetical protein
MNEKTKLRWQLAAAWSGLIYVFLYGIFWYGVAHFYDPASAALTPAELGQFYGQHRGEILLGCSITCYIAALHLAWIALLGLKMAEIEGSMPVLSVSQIIGGTLTAFVVTLPLIFWVASAFRTDSDPHIIQAFNDVAWFTIDLPWPLTTVQMLAAGIVGLCDKRSTPLFPKWACYLCIEGGLGFAFISFIPFVKSGPFAWHGLFGFWVAFIPWFLWLAVYSFYMIKDINRQLHSLEGSVWVDPRPSSTSPIPVHG